MFRILLSIHSMKYIVIYFTTCGHIDHYDNLADFVKNCKLKLQVMKFTAMYRNTPTKQP